MKKNYTCQRNTDSCLNYERWLLISDVPTSLRQYHQLSNSSRWFSHLPNSRLQFPALPNILCGFQSSQTVLSLSHSLPIVLGGS